MANQSYFDRKERKILAADTTAGISSQKGNWNRKYLETANWFEFNKYKTTMMVNEDKMTKSVQIKQQ